MIIIGQPDPDSMSVTEAKEAGLKYLARFPYMVGDPQDDRRLNFYGSRAEASGSGARPAQTILLTSSRNANEVFAYLS